MSARRIVAAAFVISLAVGVLPGAALGGEAFNEPAYWPSADELRRDLQDIGHEFSLDVGPVLQPSGTAGQRPEPNEHSVLEPDMYWQSGDLYLSATTGPLVVALKQRFTWSDLSYRSVDLGFRYAAAMEVASRLPLPPDTMQRVIRYVDGYESLRELAETEPCVRFDFAGGVIAVAASARPSSSSPSWMLLAPTGAIDFPLAYVEGSEPLYVDDCTPVPLASPALAHPAPPPSPSPDPADAPKVFTGTGESWTDAFFLRAGSYTLRFDGATCDEWTVALYDAGIVTDEETPATTVVVNTLEATTPELDLGSYYLWVGGSGIGGGALELAPCRWTVTVDPA